MFYLGLQAKPRREHAHRHFTSSRSCLEVSALVASPYKKSEVPRASSQLLLRIWKTNIHVALISENIVPKQLRLFEGVHYINLLRVYRIAATLNSCCADTPPGATLLWQDKNITWLILVNRVRVVISSVLDDQVLAMTALNILLTLFYVRHYWFDW